MAISPSDTESQELNPFDSSATSFFSGRTNQSMRSNFSCFSNFGRMNIESQSQNRFGSSVSQVFCREVEEIEEIYHGGPHINADQLDAVKEKMIQAKISNPITQLKLSIKVEVLENNVHDLQKEFYKAPVVVEEVDAEAVETEIRHVKEYYKKIHELFDECDNLMSTNSRICESISKCLPSLFGEAKDRGIQLKHEYEALDQEIEKQKSIISGYEFCIVDGNAKIDTYKAEIEFALKRKHVILQNLAEFKRLLASSASHIKDFFAQQIQDCVHVKDSFVVFDEQIKLTQEHADSIRTRIENLILETGTLEKETVDFENELSNKTSELGKVQEIFKNKQGLNLMKLAKHQEVEQAIQAKNERLELEMKKVDEEREGLMARLTETRDGISEFRARFEAVASPTLKKYFEFKSKARSVGKLRGEVGSFKYMGKELHERREKLNLKINSEIDSLKSQSDLLKKNIEEQRLKKEEKIRIEIEEKERKKMMIIMEQLRKKEEEEKARKEKEEQERRMAEEAARKKAEEEAKKLAEEEAKKQAEEEAKKQAEEEAKKRAEEEARKQAEEEARKEAEEAAKKKAEEEARKEAQEAAKKEAEEEEARKEAEETAKKKAEEEAKKVAEEARIKKEEQEKAEEERKKEAEEAGRKQEEERKEKEKQEKKAEEERKKKKKAEEEKAKKAEEAAKKKKAAEERKKKAEEDQKKKEAEEERTRKAEEEAKKKQAEEERKKKAEEERKKKAEEERKKKAEELEAKRKRNDEEIKKRAQEEIRRRQAEEETKRRLLAEEERKKKKMAEEEAKKKAEEERQSRLRAHARRSYQQNMIEKKNRESINSPVIERPESARKVSFRDGHDTVEIPRENFGRKVPNRSEKPEKPKDSPPAISKKAPWFANLFE